MEWLGNMAEGMETTPNDELTGLPLPILMASDDFFLDNERRTTNFHHHFHPKVSEELGYSAQGQRLAQNDPLRLAGFAQRFSRGQQVPKWLHARYHDIFYGPSMATATKDKFATVVLACAGVVPREAIDLSRPGEYDVVDLNNKQHEFIRRKVFFEGATSLAKSSKRDHIGKFLAEYAMQNSLNEVITEKEVKKRINEFLRPKTEIQKTEAGRFILEHVIGASVAGLIPIHQEAVKEGMAKKQKDLGRTVIKFFNADRFADYFNPLTARLAENQ